VWQLKFHWNVSFAGGSLVAGIIVLPLMLIYTAISFSVFRGKVASSASGD
jgi:cytochrome bd-type quinol oxidase subunit 2